MTAFDPGTPIMAGDLIEDGDGAPLPHELQRGGRISLAVWDALARSTFVDLLEGGAPSDAHEDILRRLAPILWPLLPSNDASPVAQLGALRAENERLSERLTGYDDGFEAGYQTVRDVEAERDRLAAQLQAVTELYDVWHEWRGAGRAPIRWIAFFGSLRRALGGSAVSSPTDQEPKLTAEDYAEVAQEASELWRAALEREGNLAGAVADVMWKATPYGTTEDGDVYAYIVPKGCMHRLIGVAQSNGAHVPVAFRALPEEVSSPTEPATTDDGRDQRHAAVKRMLDQGCVADNNSTALANELLAAADRVDPLRRRPASPVRSSDPAPYRSDSE